MIKTNEFQNEKELYYTIGKLLEKTLSIIENYIA